MMTHREIENQDIIERYVRGKLGAEERSAFQEHFFTCDECFANVQTTERFIAGVKHAAEREQLEAESVPRRTPAVSDLPFRWLKPAFVLISAASLALAAVVGWLLLVHLPQSRQELAREQQAREQLTQEQRGAGQVNAQSNGVQQSRPPTEQPKQELANNAQRTASESQNQSASQRPVRADKSPMIATNVPLVILQATRGAQEANELMLRASARSFVLWIEPGPRTEFDSFRVEVLTENGRLVHSVEDLVLNASNALRARLPAQAFTSGGYRVQVYGVNKAQTVLVGEYKLRIERH